MTTVECGLDMCENNDDGLCTLSYINLYLHKEEEELLICEYFEPEEE